MRRVIYSRYNKAAGEKYYVLEPVGEATFHQFGVAYEELDGGPGNYSTAIIEHDDGTIENVPVETIKFIVEPVKELFGGVNDALSKLTIRG